MKTITLTKGKEPNIIIQGFALIDDEDFELVSQRKWYSAKGYAVSNDSERVKMHRIVMNPPADKFVDHIDRNPLNNQKNNLRIVGMEENIHNRTKIPNTINNFKGTQLLSHGVWQARCRIYKNDFHLGTYSTELAAAIAYNRKAIELSDCILLNEINLSEEEQSAILIRDSRPIPVAEKQSSVKGLYWNKKGQKWEVRIKINNKYVQIGTYPTEQEAIMARINALEKS
jgi:hypothetical protein